MSADQDTIHAAQACWDFFCALCDTGFDKNQAIQIVSAWYGRPLGIDAATTDAIYRNFAEALRGEDAE